MTDKINIEKYLKIGIRVLKKIIAQCFIYINRKIIVGRYL